VFFDEDNETPLLEPRYIERSDITDKVFAPDTHLLEINSKSGLYPLYLAYNVYRRRLSEMTTFPESLEEHQAIWDRVLEENIYAICKTPMAKSITHRTLHGFRKAKTNMWAPDDLINKIKNQPELFIKKVHDLIGNNVKINAIVGNPPYQANNGGGKSSSGGASIYPYFVESACKLSENYVSMIMPSRWYSGNSNRAIAKLRKSICDSQHLRDLHDYQYARDCFNNVEIKGGVCYFTWDKDYIGDSDIFVHENGEILEHTKRQLVFGNTDVVLRYKIHCLILGKILNTKFSSFNNIVSSNDPFGFDVREADSMKRVKPKMLVEGNNESVQFYYYGWRNQGIRYIDIKYIRRNADWINRVKILVPKSWGVGIMKVDRLHPFIVDANSCCTETYLVIGPFDNNNIASNVIKYINTKFFHVLVFASKNTQNSMQEDYRFVPMQDFSESSDIDWSKDVADIDQQLYSKYGLTDDEVQFIESMIKPM
jgi:hypothetical protein